MVGEVCWRIIESALYQDGVKGTRHGNIVMSPQTPPFAKPAACVLSWAMSAESPRFNLYSKIVREAHDHAYRLGGDPEIIDRVVPGLVTSALDAYDAGLSREEVVKAIEEGLGQGELQCADPVLTADYWSEVQTEMETFWANRYDANRSEDWS